jgi:hypothetical protein
LYFQARKKDLPEHKNPPFAIGYVNQKYKDKPYQISHFKTAMNWVLSANYGGLPVGEFSPKKLRDIRVCKNFVGTGECPPIDTRF